MLWRDRNVNKFRAWLKSLLDRPGPRPGHEPASSGPRGEWVSFLDVVSNRVVRIPASELRPGCVQARVEGIAGIVWLLPEQLQQGEIRHPPFDEALRAVIRDIREAFAEHRDLSFEEWEDGFRRDVHAEREIAIWSCAADVYRHFAADEPSAGRRADVYSLLIACMTTTSPESVWHVVELSELARPEAERIVRRFYGGESAETA